LRPLTPEERRSITATRLRIATAEAGDSLEAMSRRTGNVWSVSFTELVNNLAAESALTDGQLIKTARQEAH
jgi:predicted Zn-dependent protease